MASRALTKQETRYKGTSSRPFEERVAAFLVTPEVPFLQNDPLATSQATHEGFEEVHTHS